MATPDFALDERLGRMLEAWRRDIGSVPFPEVVDLATAVAIVRAGQYRSNASPDEAPIRLGD
ncbi:hypothetical protein FPZ12_013295 [Amycolatopsis acidicola]|uniref:Uncharacterized protein n=1 Tax=Amycolatopsis acidicola TaxID=2596893 RepID=A0A5N0V996_9PSEU|nr:hypothetical protein [Amycolatopsis acidicola]KAA9161833.1 hypothetical protein FPZ12_013295 [Amycolatopsis acidicola]